MPHHAPLSRVAGVVPLPVLRLGAHQLFHRGAKRPLAIVRRKVGRDEIKGVKRLARHALLDHPRGTRMPSIAIYGDSGMGKTMIMKRFRDEHPPSFNPVTGTLKTPVLAMEMTSRPGERPVLCRAPDPSRRAPAAAR